MKRASLPLLHRRQFISLLGGAAAAWPGAACGQQAAMPVIGVLYGVSAVEWTDRMNGFRRGLSEIGFGEGSNVTIEYRWADGQFDRLPAMAADLISRRVAVILAGGSSNATQAAMAATHSIPIVFTTVADPVAAGFVASLNRPGGNTTGVTTFGSELGPKRLELLRELIPKARKVVLLVNQNNPATSKVFVEDAQAAGRRLGLEIVIVSASTDSEIESALADAAQKHAAALSVPSDGFLVSRRAKIAALALQHAMPTMSTGRDSVVAGQLISYAANSVDIYRQAGTYVGRILRGAKPSDLPVLQPTKFDLVINLKTAKALGLDVPPMLLARADEVIE